MPADRRAFMACFAAFGLGGTLLPEVLWPCYRQEQKLTPEMIAAAEKLAGLSFSDDERKMMARGVQRQHAGFERLRQVPVPNSVPPAFVFQALNGVPGARQPAASTAPASRPAVSAARTDEDLAFATVGELGRLLRAGRVTSERLTKLYLARLKKHDPTLECVITLTEELALRQARRADTELLAGRDRGPLHGIPWGAKDLLDTKGIKTTWGAEPFKERVPDADACVVEKLEAAGAVLLAKLTLGALAMGDRWYGGRTRSPWNTKRGSSGSSAGSAAAVAAGLVGFAIGSETLGSIISPCTRCGATGLRPTFGRVSRRGAMALSWTMDKLGPIARSAEDCALVLEAIQGADPGDPAAVNRPLPAVPRVGLADLRVGYLPGPFEQSAKRGGTDAATLAKLKQLGVRPIPVKLPEFPYRDMLVILHAEAACAFDDITRDGRVRDLVRQDPGAWPNSFRKARMIPAVEYLRAARVRTLAMQAMEQVMAKIDVLVAPTFGGSTLVLTNLTGHPALVLPNGARKNGEPTSITFIGRLFDEPTLVAAASAYQNATSFNRRRPPL